MGIFKYIASLRPEWGTDSMMDDLNTTVTEITNATIPMLETYSRSTVGPFRSPEMIEMANDFADHMRTKRPMMVVLLEVMQNCVDNLNHIVDIHKKIFTEPNVVTAAFTFKKAMVIRFVESVKFASDYTRMVVQYAAVCETAHADSAAGTGGAFTPGDVEYIRSRWVPFCAMCAKINIKETDFSKRVDRAPNTIVNDVNENVLRQVKGNDVDPLELGMLPIYINPFYHISMAVAEWQAGRYTQAVEEYNALQLRMANLEKLKAGTNDTNLQRQIQIVEKKIADQRYKIAKLNKKYKLTAESVSTSTTLSGLALSVMDSSMYAADTLKGM